MLLVGSSRDNEVGRAHPLMRAREARVGAHTTMAELVHEKTGGSPFFAMRFLQELANRRKIGY